MPVSHQYIRPVQRLLCGLRIQFDPFLLLLFCCFTLSLLLVVCFLCLFLVTYLYLLMFFLLIVIRYPSGLLNQTITFSSQNKLDVAFLVGIMCPVALTIFGIVIFHIKKWIEKQVSK